MIGDLLGSAAGSIPDEDVLYVELDQGIDGCFGHASGTDDECGRRRCYGVGGGEMTSDAGPQSDPVRVFSVQSSYWAGFVSVTSI